MLDDFMTQIQVEDLPEQEYHDWLSSLGDPTDEDLVEMEGAYG